jgi:hypothetical protein
MSVREVLGGVGAWSVRLRDDTPRTILDRLAPARALYGLLVVTPHALDPLDVASMPGDDVMSRAAYAGVLRARPSPLELSGPGPLALLGDEDGKGPLVASTTLNGTVTNWVASLLPRNSVRGGALLDIWNVGVPSYSGTFANVTVRAALDVIARACGVEYVVRPGTVGGSWSIVCDIGPAQSVWGATASAIITRQPGRDPLYITVPIGGVAAEADMDDWTSRVVFRALGGTPTTGTAELPTTQTTWRPRGWDGALIEMARYIESAETDGSAAQALARAQLGRFSGGRQSVVLSSAQWDWRGRVRVGGTVLVSDDGLASTLLALSGGDLVELGPDIVSPVAARVVEHSWSIRAGMGVYWFAPDGARATLDLTQWVVPEDGADEIRLGSASRVSSDVPMWPTPTTTAPPVAYVDATPPPPDTATPQPITFTAGANALSDSATSITPALPGGDGGWVVAWCVANTAITAPTAPWTTVANLTQGDARVCVVRAPAPTASPTFTMSGGQVAARCVRVVSSDTSVAPVVDDAQAYVANNGTLTGLTLTTGADASGVLAVAGGVANAISSSTLTFGSGWSDATPAVPGSGFRIINHATRVVATTGSVSASPSPSHEGHYVAVMMSFAPVVGSGSTPSAPTSLAVSDQTATSFRVAWSAPSSAGSSPITGYRVVLNGTTSFDATASPFVASGLTPSTTYAVTVQARNASGLGATASTTATTTSAGSATTREAFANCMNPGRYEADPAGVPDGESIYRGTRYDWANYAWDGLDPGVSPGSTRPDGTRDSGWGSNIYNNYEACEPWYTVYAADGHTAVHAAVELRRLELQLKNESNTWVQVVPNTTNFTCHGWSVHFKDDAAVDALGWDSSVRVGSFDIGVTGYKSTDDTLIVDSVGAPQLWVKPTLRARCAHGWPNIWPRRKYVDYLGANPATKITGVYVAIEARLIVKGASDDRANARYVVSTGVDVYRTDGTVSDPNNLGNGVHCQSPYWLVPTDGSWRKIVGHTLTPAQFLLYPPIGT